MALSPPDAEVSRFRRAFENHGKPPKGKMKAIKGILAGALALVFVGAASAQSTIRITGSTAFRAATVTAVQNILQPGYTYGYNGTSATGANQSIFVGTTKIGSLPVVIKCSWGGSVGGVQTIAQQSPAVTLPTWLSESLNTLTAAGTPNLNSGNIYDSPAGADVAMSDSFQSTTQFAGTGYNALVSTVVGVVPFVWTKGASADPAVQASLDKLTNMTPLAARLILAAGAPLSMLTGNSADANIYTYPMGRDEDSGTRVVEFAESGFGVFGSPVQYQPTITGGEITAIAPWPAATVLGFSYPAGHSGFASGGTLATNLNTPVAAAARDAFKSKFALVAFFGVNDATRVNSGKNNLTYNGVAYSPEAVREGLYTCWGYEHLMYRNTLSGNAKTVADQLATQIRTADATVSGVLLSTMNVSRSTEGAVIIHN